MRTQILRAPDIADAAPAGGGGAPASTEEPGAVDNRLSLDPSADEFKGYVDEWEDGQEYVITLKATQISPGELTVTEIQDAKPAGDAEAKPGDEEAGEPPATEIDTTTDNPAIKNLMKE
jgi:hypothetical protein